jgi:hypothetical protein
LHKLKQVQAESAGRYQEVASASRLRSPARENERSAAAQGGADLEQAFTALGLRPRLRTLEPGVPTTIELAK